MRSWIENELIELINFDQFRLSIPIQNLSIQFQFNSCWIELIINSNSINELIQALQLAIGSDTRAYLKSLSGQVSSTQFCADVRKFFTTAVPYMLKKFPFGDKLLISAAVADPKSRAKATFSQLIYFLVRYPCLWLGTERDQLEHEFKTYHMTPLPELSQRPDEAWDTIGSMQSPRTIEKCFENLAKVQAIQTVCYQEKISDTQLRKAKQATYIANHSSA